MMKVSSKAEIKDRIEKLYALAQGGATDGEAKAAIAMAEKLTVKYGISGINKNRYKTGDKGSRIGNATKSGGHYKTYTWDEYQKSGQRKKSEGKTSKYKSRDGWIWIYADILRETEKAWLLNVHLDESKYGMDSVKVSIWMPKSQCEFPKGVSVGLKGGTPLVKKDLIMANLRNNLGWLVSNHPAFREHREFWLKTVGV